MSVLVGDVGGTKTALALAELDAQGRIVLRHECRLPSADFDSLLALVRAYLDETGVRCRQACFAVAGPVLHGRSDATNLPWVIDSAELERALGLEAVQLLNDLEALAWGVAALDAEDFATLQEGDVEAIGNACVVAAGTGLGEAGLFWDGAVHRAFATEGGHADFAPEDALEAELLLWLRERYGRVSWERVVSGSAIADLYRFLIAREGVCHPEPIAHVLDRGGDLSEAVAQAAQDSGPAICVQTMRWFARLYGREAGNMALKMMALGGVYLGGGVAPKNLALLSSGVFLDAFLDKGRMRVLMERMPVRVILNERAPLLGAARYHKLKMREDRA